MPLAVLLPALALAFAFADRFAGGAYVTALRAKAEALAASLPTWESTAADTVLNARAVAWSALALAVILALLGLFTPYGPKLALLALGFAAWRWAGWGTFGGSIDPKTHTERVGLFERHALALPAFAVPVLVLRFEFYPFVAAVFGLGVFAAVATLLGVVLAAEERSGFDVNAVIEPIRGAFLGATLALILI